MRAPSLFLVEIFLHNSLARVRKAVVGAAELGKVLFPRWCCGETHQALRAARTEHNNKKASLAIRASSNKGPLDTL